MTEFLQPPPTNFSVPPPPVPQQQMHTSPSQQNQSPSAPHYSSYPRERHYHGGFSGKNTHYTRSYNNFRGPNNMSQEDFDGKRLRKSVMRKTVDYNSSIVRELEVSEMLLSCCNHQSINVIVKLIKICNQIYF